MLKLKDVTGRVFTGRSYRGIVRSMRDGGWVVVPKRQYIKEVAQRLRILGTYGISSRNSTEFVKSLLKTGWLRKVTK